MIFHIFPFLYALCEKPLKMKTTIAIEIQRLFSMILTNNEDQPQEMDEDFRLSKFFKPLFVEKYHGFRCAFSFSETSTFTPFGFNPIGVGFEHFVRPNIRITSALSNVVKWKICVDENGRTATLSSTMSTTGTRICARVRTADTSIRAILSTKRSGNSIFASHRLPIVNSTTCKDVLVASSIIDSVLVGIIAAQWSFWKVKELHGLLVLQSNRKAIVGLGVAQSNVKVGTVARFANQRLTFRHAAQFSDQRRGILVRTEGYRLSQVVLFKYADDIPERRIALKLNRESSGRFSLGFSLHV